MASEKADNIDLKSYKQTYGSVFTGDTTEAAHANNASAGYVVFGDETVEERDRLKSQEDDHDNGLELYEEDLKSRPKISRMLRNLANYNGGIVPSPSEMDKSSNVPQATKLGTVLGVYLPCLQNIFGVILFVRLTWIVGTAGWLEAFFLVLLCCCCTMLTAISMSAIATNGVVPGGGAYFMISRSLGPEFGGAVGILFYLGNTVATAMYCLGAVEIFLKYMAPSAMIVGKNMNDESDAANNYRIYGTFLILILFVCVFLGMRFVSIVAAISLSCVLLSILSIYAGLFSSTPYNSVKVCFLGDRLLKLSSYTLNGTSYCTKNETLNLDSNVTVQSPLWKHYCGNASEVCDPFWLLHDVTLKPAIPGLTSKNFYRNMYSSYRDKGQYVSGNLTDKLLVSPYGDPNYDIVSEMSTSFTVLVAIFFPSVTGIMAGSNRSGDLKDASKSIPIGTILAIITTSIVYLSNVLLFAASVEGDVLRDKFGESVGGRLVVSKLAWPHYWVILIGSFLSTVGAGLQSLTGAPRVLNAIAKDGVIPFLKVFSQTTKKGEPLYALILTTVIAEAALLIAKLDYVAPILTMFFLMCYGFVNFACALQTLLKSPSWRPRFRFYHWSLSLIGVGLCVSLMFISGWYYALIAFGIAIGIYKYIEYKGAENEWGDGLRGLSLSAARFALLKLDENPPHTKNWRPQILMLSKLDDNLIPRYPKMFAFAGQLKAGKGLIIAASIVQGDFLEKSGEAAAAKQELNRALKEHRVKGFSLVLVSKDVQEGLGHVMQSAGLGGLKPNTIMLGWPLGWRHEIETESLKTFVMAIRQAEASNNALLVLKGIQLFPSNSDKLSGTIDVWWIVHDGGLLMLLPFLLKQHKVWKNCVLRIFTVAQSEDNSIQMRNDLETFLYHLRIQAQVHVIEMTESDVSAYAYGRTVIMEQRTKLLQELNLSKKEKQFVLMTDYQSRSQPEVDDDDEEIEYNAVSSRKKEIYSFDAPNTTSSNVKLESVEMDDLLKVRPEKGKVKRMHTAVRINELIVEKSHEAKLILINLPGPPSKQTGFENYMEYLEVLTEGLDRVVLVRGSGREVITIFS